MSDDLRQVRQAFAELVTRDIDVERERIRDAFATVPREAFLGKGPWLTLTLSGYAETASSEPAAVYQPVGIALEPDLNINNGEPPLHARMLSAAAPQTGEDVVHIGTGSGYYTAILAELVGPEGTVTGYEILESVGRRALAALARRPNVTIRLTSGSEAELPEADVIYVCAGASRPGRPWLNALRPGGRLIFPLTPNEGLGGILKIRRPKDAGSGAFEAGFVTPAMFIPCEGMRGPEADALSQAFQTRSMSDVRSLQTASAPDQSAWFVWEDGLWLSTRRA